MNGVTSEKDGPFVKFLWIPNPILCKARCDGKRSADRDDECVLAVVQNVMWGGPLWILEDAGHRIVDTCEIDSALAIPPWTYSAKPWDIFFPAPVQNL